METNRVKEPNRVREFRKRKGWVMQELRARSGIGCATLVGIEKHGCPSRRETKERLAKALGAPVTTLWPLEGGGESV